MEGSEDTEFDFLSTVKSLLGIDGNDKDGRLQVFIAMSRQSILNYCNISELPEALNFTLCQMTADTYRDATLAGTKGEVSGSVGSISEDGRSVSFTSGAEFKTALEDRISRTKELNRYRKLYRVDA